MTKKKDQNRPSPKILPQKLKIGGSFYMIATTDLVIHIYAKQENVSEHKEILPAMTEERSPLYR